MNDTTVTVLYEVAVKPGQLDALRTLMAELVDAAQTEAGTLAYGWSLSDDESVVHFAERYADSDATLSHLAKFRGTFLQRFLEAVEPMRSTVYGTPSEKLRKELKAPKSIYMSAFEGFAR